MEFAAPTFLRPVVTVDFVAVLQFKMVLLQFSNDALLVVVLRRHRSKNRLRTLKIGTALLVRAR